MKTIRISPLSHPIVTSLTIPGSKSYTNRALILASLVLDPVRIMQPLFSDDTKAMIGILRKLGIKILMKRNAIEVVGSIMDVQNKNFFLNANLSGTTLRFILPVLTIVPGIKIVQGKEGLNKRPITVLVNALRELGAKIEYLDKEGFPPVKIISSTVRSGEINLKGNISSQYFSALLMILPLIGNSIITTKGEQISKPYVDMTLEAMRKFGIEVTNEKNKKYIITKKQNYKLKEYIVEGDFSSAGYFFAIAALTKSTITLKNLNPDSLQADRKILDVLKQMGSKILRGENEITITGNGVKPFIVNVVDFPDSAQTLTLIAAFAKGTSKISGIQSLRIKETNRILALQKELKKMGIKTSSTRETLTIYGGNPKSATIDTYGDHRMAMSFAVTGAMLSGMKVRDPDVVTKTFPHFWSELRNLGIKVKEENNKKNKIVLIGFMGSGKSSIAPHLAEKLHATHVEMDTKILDLSKEKSITKIFEKFGEEHFRKLEQKMAESLINERDVVISAGGGVVMNKKTVNALSKNATVIFLSTKFETLQKRLDGSIDRPLWKDLSKAKSLFELRQPLYKRAADITVHTDEKSIGSIVKEITENI